MSKSLYLIRHGKALHNELFERIGSQAFRIPEGVDPPLIKEGIDQSIELGKTWINKKEIELVLVSPLLRTLETAMNIFGKQRTPIVCQEFLREYPLGRDTCNKRSDRDFLKKNFPKIDFSNLEHNEDILWRPDTMESIKSLENRINRHRIRNRYFVDGKKRNTGSIKWEIRRNETLYSREIRKKYCNCRT